MIEMIFRTTSALYPILHHHCQSPTTICLQLLYHPTGFPLKIKVVASGTHTLTHLIFSLPTLILKAPTLIATLPPPTAVVTEPEPPFYYTFEQGCSQ